MSNAKKKIKVFDGRYEILSIVGRGSASVVYHARHLAAPEQQVALKVLVAKNQLLPRSDLLRKEALAMVSARHQYVIRLDDFYSVGELCYLSMEFAPYGDLRRYVQGTGSTLMIPQAKTFLTQSADALQYIHDAGILHRDIKPDNILVMSPKAIRLGDFGVALLPGEESSLSELQRGVGTLNYMAPEVLDGVRYDNRCDLYALGVCFYEMLSGVHPFESASLIDQMKIRQDGNFAPLSALVPELPPSLNTAIMELLRFNPDDRIPNAGVLKDILASRGQPRTVGVAPGARKGVTSVPGAASKTSATFDRMREIHEARNNKTEKSTSAVKPEDHNATQAKNQPIDDSQTVPAKDRPVAAGIFATKPKEKVKGVTEPDSTTSPTADSASRTSSDASEQNQGKTQSRPSASDRKNRSSQDPARSPQGRKNNASSRVSQQESALQQTAVLSAEEAQSLSSKALQASQHTAAEPSKTSEFFAAPVERKSGPKKRHKAPSDDLQQQKSLAVRDPASKGRKKLSKKQLLRRTPMLAFIVVVIVLIVFLLSSKPSRGPEAPTAAPELSLEERLAHNDLLAPKLHPATTLEFPNLPVGSYTGRIQGLFGRRTTSMLVIAGEEDITLLLGEPGLSAKTVSRNAILQEPPALRFALDGQVLQFAGVVFDEGLIGGTVVNLVSGEEGSFQLSTAVMGLGAQMGSTAEADESLEEPALTSDFGEEEAALLTLGSSDDAEGLLDDSLSFTLSNGGASSSEEPALLIPSAYQAYKLPLPSADGDTENTPDLNRLTTSTRQSTPSMAENIVAIESETHSVVQEQVSFQGNRESRQFGRRSL